MTRNPQQEPGDENRDEPMADDSKEAPRPRSRRRPAGRSRSRSKSRGDEGDTKKSANPRRSRSASSKSDTGASDSGTRRTGSEEEPERDQETNLEPNGMGLGTKLILLVLAAQIFAAAFMFALSLHQTKNALREEIDRAGEKVALVLSSLDPDYLKETQGTKTPPRRWLKEHLKSRGMHGEGKLYRALVSVLDVPAGGKGIQKKVKKFGQEAVKVIDEAFNKLVDAEEFKRDIQGENFLDPLTEGDSDIKLIRFSQQSESGRWEPIFSSTFEQLNRDVQSTVVSSEKNEKYNLEIRKNRINGEPVRIYELIQKHRSPENRMRVTVYLSSQKIQEAAGRMTTTLLLVAGLSVIFGGIAGWIFSGKIINPIKALLADINAVSKGNLDHHTVPKSQDEIGVIARTFNKMTKSLKEAQKRELEAKALEHELNIAMEVQGELLPKRKPQLNGWDIDAYYKPSKEVGGDYYDFIRIDEDHIGMVVADVSGKGVPGSMVMTMTRAMIRMEATRNLSTKETLIRTNQMLAKDIREGMFVTCMYLILDIPNSKLHISSAGHNPLVLWREEKEQVYTVNPNGIALGFDEGPLFERTIEENKVQLKKGDRFVIYTDGIVEAMSPDEQEFGEETFYQLCGKLARRDSNQFTNIVVQQIAEHQKDAPQHDDITILTARYNGA